MAKYNVGDVLEITEYFELEGVSFIAGDKYTVSEIYSGFYDLRDYSSYVHTVTISEVDAHSGFRKVDPRVEHMELGKTYQSTSNDLFYTPTEFDFAAGRVAFDYVSDPWSLARKSTRKFDTIEEEFGVLPPVKPETQEEPKFKVGQVWHNTCGSELRITEVDGSNITYVFAEGGTRSTRSDDLTVGWALVTQEVVTTEPTQKALDELKEKLNPENTLAEAVDSTEVRWEGMCAPSVPKPETISVDSLREALDFLGIQEVFDTENIIALAKRLS